ncbi:ABC-2 family transporter protein [Bacillus toyonensis]|uniref:ABC transporter permease n=1 Tax=Bacillus toyonensis TaxID=155322 RepID=UPI0018CFF840|nr:ABC-2 family transporter protein [Bacillus toyonensis]MBH0357138.1 hypothetical protein [Bacillus toyonensis biovar Thuringiensis]
MRKYWELLKSQIKIDTTYRAWYWANTISSILRLFIMYFFWLSVYENKTEIAEIPFSSMITYIVLAMLLESYVTGVGTTLATNIKEGNISIELLKPYNYLDKLVFMDLGSKFSNLFKTTIPVLFFAVIFLDIELPQSIESFLLFLPSMLMGILIGTQLDLIIGVLAFWTINIWGLKVLREAIVKFLSGALVPLTLFPDWFQGISNYLPFQSMIYIPISIYTGQIEAGSASLLALVTQFFWLITIFILVRIIWHFSVKKVTIFGG